MLAAVLPATAEIFGRAMVMPNLKVPVTTARAAADYRARIHKATPPGSNFKPLMTCYLTESLDPADLAAGYRDGLFSAAKYYPAGATTNSAAGVTGMRRIYRLLDLLQSIGMPILIHGEVVDKDVDVFDREAVFIERVLGPLRLDLPALKIVFEHVTTAEGVDFVESASGPTAATITPHHLMINRNAMFDGGLRPHAYCLPVLKRERHRRALRAAATSGNPRFFIGTDSAPHLRNLKEHDCGCAGIFNAPTALGCYAQVFDEENRLENLEGFTSHHGPAFYSLPVNESRVVLTRAVDVQCPQELSTSMGTVRVFLPPGGMSWRARLLI